MSTRCQILFQQEIEWENQKTGELERRVDKVLTYKHSDGYPDVTVSKLQDYYNWMPRNDDLEYFVATWVYFVKRWKEEHWEEENPIRREEVSSHNHVTRQIGICGTDHFHMGTVHFYIVKLDEEVIEHYSLIGAENPTYPDYFEDREPDQVYPLEVEEEADENPPAESSVQPAKDGGDS
ncbi:MAG: hypothetical protein ACI9LV_000791 [Candidatus Nanohaloarchaea archaeon]|jgi:hypothetical protein